MLRKLVESFTATHVTIMFGIAVLAPSALYAIPSYSNVAIENVTTGVRAAVDSTGHLLTNDSVGNYSVTPQNIVSITLSPSDSCTIGYTVPAGKALILTAASTLSYVVSGQSYGIIYLYRGTSSIPCTKYILGNNSTQAGQTNSQPLGNGIAIPAGSVLAAIAVSEGVMMTLNGYLVPAGAVPALGTQEEAGLSVGTAPTMPRPRR